MGPLGEHASLLRSLQEISVGAGQISIKHEETSYFRLYDK